MKLTQFSKISENRGLTAMFALMLVLGMSNAAQAWQGQAAKAPSTQPVTGTVHIQNAVIIPGPHTEIVNHAIVALPFPPCYSVDYKNGPSCNYYGDRSPQGGTAVGVHLFAN